MIYVDADATAVANDGSSWADAFTDLQDVLSAAASGDEIWVAEGTYRPTTGSDRAISFQLAEGVALYGGFAGTESLRSERDWEAHETTLSGDLNGDDGPDFANYGENSYVVVFGADGATLDGLTVTAGYGGPSGGGMYNFDKDSLTVTNCTFLANSANTGGALHNEWYSSPTITGCLFLDNMAKWGAGGAMYNTLSSSPSITDCTFSGNTADEGGAIFNAAVPSTITECRFSGNTADEGGGIWHGGSSLTVANCAFSGNSAYWDGGGMYNVGAVSSTITNCTFWGNSAGWDGGGMYNMTCSPALTNCTFSGNTAGHSGGGMCTSSSTVTNCVLWGDSSPMRPEIYGPCTVSHSDVGQVGGFITDGGGNINADPRFVDAGRGNLRLWYGSPCIDCADGNAAPETDKDGNPRHDDSWIPNSGVGDPPYVDMGAYEFQLESYPPVTPFAGGCVPPSEGPVPAGKLAVLTVFVLAALARRRRLA